jgi:hypothetical protein
LSESRKYLRGELDRLPDHLHGLRCVLPPYPVSFSERLEADLLAVRRKLGFGASETVGRT